MIPPPHPTPSYSQPGCNISPSLLMTMRIRQAGALLPICLSTWPLSLLAKTKTFWTWEASLFQPSIQRVKHDLVVCGLLDSGLLRDVEAVKELSDILVLHRGRLLDQSRRLGHSLNGVALQRQTVSMTTWHISAIIAEIFLYSTNQSWPGQSAHPSGTCCSQL